MSEKNIEARLVEVEGRLEIIGLALNVAQKVMETHQSILEEILQKLQVGLK